MIYLAAVLLVLILLAGWVFTLIGMPGNWLMLAATAVYVLLIPADSPVGVGWVVVAVLGVLALLGELFEFLAGAMGTAKAGGSRRAALLALAGSVIGGVLGVFIGMPVPVVGSVVASVLCACLGALAGAIIGESWAGRRLTESWQVGKGAFRGRLLGTVAKTVIASAMVAVATAAVVF